MKSGVRAGSPQPRRHIAVAHARRFREIASVFARHGLGWVMGPWGVGRLVPFHRGWLGHPRRDEPYARHEHIRMLLEDLGPTFVKIGQILSSRADLLRPHYRAELAVLQDHGVAVRAAAIHAIIEQELARPALSVFAEFDSAPLASASIGQAHAARLHEGARVVVKVRRPGVIDQIELDLRFISTAVRLVARFSSAARAVDAVDLFDEFAVTLRQELSYHAEADNAERFAANFSGHPAVVIPRVHHAFSTDTVLTLDLIDGTKIDDVDALRSRGIDPAVIAAIVVDMELVMIFEHGFFHADPHPGNIFVQPDGRVGLIDFGMVGRLDNRSRSALIGLLAAIATGDVGATVDALIDIGIADNSVNRAGLERDLEKLTRNFVDVAVTDINMADLLHDHLSVLRRHHLRLPRDLALLIKNLGMLEGLAALLDPQFRLMDALVAFAASHPALVADRERHASS